MTELHEELAAAMEGCEADGGSEGLPAVAHALTVALDHAGLLGVVRPRGDQVRVVLLDALRVLPVLGAAEVRDLLTRFYNRSDDEAAGVVAGWLDRRRDGR